ALLVATLTRADEPLLRSRPALVVGKYARMATSPFEFYRGSLALYARDLRDGSNPASRTRFALDAPATLPLALGDPHPENFGTLRAADGSLAVEPNDFASADRLPYLWDVRRLAAGMAVAARWSNADDSTARAAAAAEARAIAAAAAQGYAEGIRALADG